MDLIFGSIAFIFMGIILGLVGAGGSVLTIPILIYAFHIPIFYATTYSLIIVGCTASLAAIRHRNKIAYWQAMLFAIPSFSGMIASRRYVVPQIPSFIGPIKKEDFVLILFVIFMIGSGYAMQRPSVKSNPKTIHPLLIGLLGLVTGMIMGLLGAGGGFLIIPVLSAGLGLTMDRAVATSLFIITLNSWVGFFSDPSPLTIQDWFTIFYALLFAISGMLLGLSIAHYWNGDHLKRFFGHGLWLLASAMAIQYVMNL